MHISALRKMADREVIDYPFLMSALQAYAYPRDKISTWIKSGDLIRVKKGLYVFGKQAALHPYSLEVLANLIYGPSAISLSYALSWYGLIPEKVTTVTSITNKRNKGFSTDVGCFKYYYLRSNKFSVGLALEQLSPQVSFMIASPEKALFDQIYLLDKKIELMSPKSVEHYLFDDLRIDEDHLKQLNKTTFNEVSNIYQNKRINFVNLYLQKRL